MKFTWYGKENAIIESMTPSTGALRPDKESSKNWDNTENLYIEGDNLEVLKLLQKSYFGKVKMIYIDPPYNTGKDFVYKDNFRDNITNYKEITSQTTKANPETNGRYHTDWLNMMYPRLKLARNLLREDGVIFISIDDNEVDNLKKVCSGIFGEENFVECLIWKKRATPPNDKNIGRIHEFILCYAKSINSLELNLLPRDEKSIKRYSNPDNDERGPWVASDLSANGKGGRIAKSCIYPIINPNNQKEYMPSEGRCWLFNKEKMDLWIREGRVAFRDNTGAPFLKRYLSEVRQGLTLPTIMTEFGYSQTSVIEMDKIFNKKGIFEYAKPTTLIKPLIRVGTTSKDDIVLDFFSGVSTTADAVMQLNMQESKNIKYIMVQLPEKTTEKSIARECEFMNICEIGKKRIRIAGDKIVSENKDKEGIENLDIGFKVFKLEYNCGGENHSTMEEGIKVDIIKRPKDKPICKFKVHGELYYLVKTNEDVIVFPYKSSIKGKVIASIFNIELCKNKDYMQLEYLYNMKLNEFNGEDFIHSQYVTSVILDNVYKTLND